MKLSSSGFLNDNNHPERQEGEVFLSNGTLEKFSRCVGWKTKRRGTQAYTNRGARIHSMICPIFVQSHEIEEAERTSKRCHI